MIHSSISSLIAKLRNDQALTDEKAMIGFDGYIDNIQKVVQSADSEPAGRQAGRRTYFKDISQLATHIAKAAGKSAQLELRTETKKMGGNGPIMSHALGSLGIKNYCVGMLGAPDLNPVFDSMHSNCYPISLGPSATTNALEFEDGKLILSEVSTFDELDWDYIIKSKQEEAILNCMDNSQLIALVDWSNLPRCNRLWKDVYNIAKQYKWKNKIYFFDLCDPSKKSSTDIKDVLEIINLFSGIGKTILGLNENEALKIHQALVTNAPTQTETLSTIASAIFKSLSIDYLLIHPVDRCLLVTQEKQIEIKGAVVKNPKILTGGGDNLNAGFCFGLLNDFTNEECLLSAMATSGAYVQNGVSPNTEELITYLEKL